MRAAVLGSPIAHSLSPALHRAAYAALGLDWQYDAIEVPSGGLGAFLGSLEGEWAGLSLTMPLKQEVLPFLDDRSPLVELTGAANTVVLLDGDRAGHNTDVGGIVAAFREAGVTSVGHAAVLGAGATAASALAAVAELGCSRVTVLARSRSRALALGPVAGALGVEVEYDDLDPSRLADCRPGVVVSTVPAGALDAAFAASCAATAEVPLLDVVYAPWPTPLAAAYLRAGATVVGGAQMLLHQAAAQVALMTGRDAPLEAMRAVLPA